MSSDPPGHVSKWFGCLVTPYSEKCAIFHKEPNGGDDQDSQQKRSVPRPRIELGTHGSSGHVPSGMRIRAGTQSRRHMVMTYDKWFNEKDGEQAFSVRAFS
jgi:hypothetical protein